MTTGQAVRLRVTVTDVWDTVVYEAAPDATVGDVKAACLAEATGRAVDPAAYQVKFRGALVLDETIALDALGAGEGAALIVLPARRRPVR